MNNTQLSEMYDFIIESGLPQPEVGVILGSGLGGFADRIKEKIELPYGEIPYFPVPTIEGHSGMLIAGRVGGKTVWAFSGRFHFYEGHSLEKTVLPVSLAKFAGAKYLLVSNAAGGINYRYRVGDLMIIDDFLHMNHVVSIRKSNRQKRNTGMDAHQVQSLAAEAGIATQLGTYLFTTGPNYETPSEIHAFRSIGADAIGMSTVPELIEASFLGLPFIAVSLITNAAAGISDQKLNHEEVKLAAAAAGERFCNFFELLISKLNI